MKVKFTEKETKTIKDTLECDGKQTIIVLNRLLANSNFLQ